MSAEHHFPDPGESICSTIVNQIAVHEGIEPLELPPLYDSVDPDALNDVFTPTKTGVSRTGTISFSYCGYSIVVDVDDEAVTSIVEESE